MKALREYLMSYLRQHPIQQGLNMAKLLESWPDLLGDYLAERLVPVTFDKGILVCQVVSSGLVQELQFLEADILSKLKLFEGGAKIRKLKLVAGNPMRKQDSQQLQQIEKARQQRLNAYHLVNSGRPSALDLAQLEQQTEAITDPELRQKTSKLFQAMILRQKQLQAQKWQACKRCHTYYEPGYKECPYCRSRKND